MDDIPARLVTQDGSVVYQGGLVEAEWRAAGVEVLMVFEREAAPLLPIGEAVQLGVASEAGDMLGRGRIHGRRDEVDAVYYRLQLDSAGTLQLGALLNRRQEVRVRPADGELIYVRLDWSNGERDLIRVRELSSTGLSALVEGTVEERLLEVHELSFKLHLAGIEALVIDGHIRNRSIEGSQVALGIEFDARTARFGHVQEQIFGWIAERHQRSLAPPGLAV